ncbi:hypothetical protein [Nitrospira sp. Nam74]
MQHHGFQRNCLLLVVLLCTSCSSPPSYHDAFSSSHQVPGSSGAVPVALDIAWGSTLEVLSQQGFLIQQADTKSHIILANREIRDQQDTDLSYSVTSTITLVPQAEQITRVIVAANQTTELHKKEYRWWKLLWLVPLIPYGTDYTTVVVNRDTVREPQFYQQFFNALKSTSEQKQPAALRPTQ